MPDPITAALRLGALAAALALLAGCGEKEEPDPAAESPAASAPQPADERERPGERRSEAERDREPEGDAEPRPERRRPRGSAAERQALRTVRTYIAALDARDGATVCRLLAPGAIEQVKLPRRRGGCAASLDASIGYRDPRGLPVFASARLTNVTARLTASAARIVATVVTRFADRDQPSIEDDVIYLTRRGGGWLIVKPSTSLYRAVGIADVPPTVIAPPG